MNLPRKDQADALSTVLSGGLDALPRQRHEPDIGDRQAIGRPPELTGLPIPPPPSLYARGEIDGALKSFERAVAKSPSLADAWYGRSLAFEASGNSVAALGAYDRFVELAATNASSRADRGRARDLEARRRLAAPQTHKTR